MKLDKLVKEILNNIDISIKSNPSFIKILNEFLGVIKGVDEHYRIDVEESIYSKIENKHYNDTYKININDIILNVEYVESMDKGKIVSFTIQKKKNYIVTFTVSDENDITKLVSAEVTFNENDTSWKVGTERVNNDGYYYEYNYNIFKFDKNHRPIKGNYDEELDKDFATFFNVPLKDARKYRKNFEANTDCLNKFKKIGCMNKLDELYCSDKIQFGESYTFDDLDNYFVNIEEDMFDDVMEDLDDENEDEETDDLEISDDSKMEETDEELLKKYEDSFKRIDNIKSLIKSVTGKNGLFTMTQNLIMNISNYITSTDGILNTRGFIIRKLDKYTLYYVIINGKGITHMSREISLKEAQELFYSHEFNKNIFGLNEFFEIDKDNSLKLDNN